MRPSRQHMALWPPGSGSCCKCPGRLAEKGDPLCGSPRRRGASCTSFVTPFGPLCLWLPRSGPTWQLKAQTDICSFQPPGERGQTETNRPCSPSLCTLYSYTCSVCLDGRNVLMRKQEKSHIKDNLFPVNIRVLTMHPTYFYF